MKNNYIERTYYTMEDGGVSIDQLKSVCKEPDGHITQELLRLIQLKHKYDWILYEDVPYNPWVPTEEPVLNAKKIDAWLSDFGYIQQTTYDRYAKLIELYQSEKDKLLGKITSESVNTFNDTPQDVMDGKGDGYTSSITSYSTSVDPNEMINRLKNIEVNYKDTFEDWVDEFKDLFGEEVL